MWCQLVDGLKIGYKLTENNGDSMKFPLDRYDVMPEFDPSVLIHETWTAERGDAMTYSCVLERALPR